MIETVESTQVSDLITLYLKQIGKKPLLTREEEIELAKKKDGGCKESARELAERNLRLVIRLASKVLPIANGTPFEDLIQYGDLGLMRAVELFDHTKGYKFCTYATWWVRQAIGRGIMDKSRVIRIPVNIQEAKSKIKKELERLGATSISAEHLAEVLDVKEKRAQEILNTLSTKMSVVSFDAPTTIRDGADRDVPLIETLPDDAVEERLDNLESTVMLEKLLEQADLSKQEYRVISLLFLKDEPMPNSMVAKCLKCSRQATNQYKKEAFKKIKRAALSLGFDPSSFAWML